MAAESGGAQTVRAPCQARLSIRSTARAALNSLLTKLGILTPSSSRAGPPHHQLPPTAWPRHQQGPTAHQPSVSLPILEAHSPSPHKWTPFQHHLCVVPASWLHSWRAAGCTRRRHGSCSAGRPSPDRDNIDQIFKLAKCAWKEGGWLARHSTIKQLD